MNTPDPTPALLVDAARSGDAPAGRECTRRLADRPSVQ
jgi:hypothetical protein